ncbi:MAG: hypothetical protein WCD76_21375 [Pyrinomonadaceae bacterium]
MLKKLLFTLALALVYGGAQAHAQTAQPTPTPERVPRDWMHPDDELRLLAASLPECGAVTASEQMPYVGHFETLVLVEKRKAFRELTASLEPLRARRETVLNLRAQIVSYYGSRTRAAAPALKALDAELRSIDREWRKLSEQTSARCKDLTRQMVQQENNERDALKLHQ